MPLHFQEEGAAVGFDLNNKMRMLIRSNFWLFIFCYKFYVSHSTIPNADGGSGRALTFPTRSCGLEREAQARKVCRSPCWANEIIRSSMILFTISGWLLSRSDDGKSWSLFTRPFSRIRFWKPIRLTRTSTN